MKSIDQWDGTDVVEATLKCREIRERLTDLGVHLSFLPDDRWAEAVADYDRLAQSLTDLFGEHWYEWLDVPSN